MKSQQVKQMIETGLPGATVIVEGEGDHFEATVIYQNFIDKTKVQQHQLVYRTLGDSMQTAAIHALSIKTYTPQEWAIIAPPTVE
jgi:acid stress-induced BolA-like protein IbaG/YrbA